MFRPVEKIMKLLAMLGMDSISFWRSYASVALFLLLIQTNLCFLLRIREKEGADVSFFKSFGSEYNPFLIRNKKEVLFWIILYFLFIAVLPLSMIAFLSS